MEEDEEEMQRWRRKKEVFGDFGIFGPQIRHLTPLCEARSSPGFGWACSGLC